MVNPLPQTTYRNLRNKLRCIADGNQRCYADELIHAGEQLRTAVAGRVSPAEIHEFDQRNRDRWVQEKGASVPEGSTVLDIGAGTSPYRPLFAHCHYTFHDFKACTGADSETYIRTLPAPNDSFDAVICTGLLEQLLEPLQAVGEMARILKPGGALFLTAPLGSGPHQLPHRYYGGFTPEWYKAAAGRYCLDVLELTPNGGFFKHLAQECARVAWTFEQHRNLHGEQAEDIRNLFNELLPRYLQGLDEACFIPQFTEGYHVALQKPPCKG